VVPSKDEDYNRGRKWEWDALNQAVARGHPNGMPSTRLTESSNHRPEILPSSSKSETL